ncbi:histidine phosphatase family protein [Frankia sp. CNm7]|uniref:Histidine phosphatase family protein n=1 Tax=Frankia nepalensis TaxID=1836974 RepID=A0A937RHZ0_9ACTN|nr:histidine phosphatase family protein [Frankia nepalensis]MBL7513399.1 histidine phosphatase family protein [Frankia nepalensis]MBL7522447.1 histidine phosphatase family protein [Frankia nepalensis]MBL7626351.1 histidine phosphatase family protein [Frankia nepalensis]
MLLRHAKSDWADAGTPDAERPLSRDGRHACTLVAEHFTDVGLAPDLILCSSALRTRQTVQRIAPALPPNVPVLTEDRLYLAEPEELLSRLRDVDDGVPSVLLVGHNPGIHTLAVALLPPADRVKIPTFPTAALAVLDLGTRRWAELGPACTRFASFVTPKHLRHAS